MAHRLGAIDPEFGRLRPDPGMRKFKPSDPGPILEMSLSELADRIERRGRFDPPKFPEPVSPEGYSVMFRNDALDASHLSVHVNAGAYERGANRNEIWVWPDIDHPLWRDPEVGIEILDAMAQCWNADWASAYAWVGTDKGGVRPWLAWTAEPLRLEPIPPFVQPYPYPFARYDVPLPDDVRPWRGGELRIWR